MKPIRIKSIYAVMALFAVGMVAITAFACTTETVVTVEVPVEVPVVETVVVREEVRVDVPVVQTVVVQEQVEVQVVETVVVREEVRVDVPVVETVVVREEVQVQVEVPVVQTVIVQEQVEVEVVREAPSRSGGEVRIGTVYVPPPLYLPSAQPSPEYWKLHAWGIAETLIRTDRDAPPPNYGAPGTSGIASGWSMDGDKMTFTVRDGASFSGNNIDWGPLTAADVVHSFTNAGQEGSRAARASLFNDVNGQGLWGCEAAGARVFTCDINPMRLHPNTLYNLSNENGVVAIFSKRVYDELGEAQAILTPHGSGPWEVTRHIGNDELVAEAKLDHWRGAPLADTLRVIEIREPSQAAAALATGAVHIAQIPSSLVLDTENRSRGRRFQLNAGLGGQAIYFGGNFWADQNYITGDPISPQPGHQPDDAHPWIGTGPDDQNAIAVRKALSKAINRDLINKSILVGLGKPIYTHGGYEQSTPYWQQRWFVEYDPAAARADLAAAGYADGFEMGFWVPSDSPFVNPEVGVAIAGQWRDVGVDVQIENTAYSARRPTLVDRSIDIPWLFINFAESGPFGSKYGRWNPGTGWNSGGELPYDKMKDWDDRYVAFDATDPSHQDDIVALNTEIEDYVQDVAIEVPVVELVKWYVIGPEVLAWRPYRHNENGPNSFESILLDR